MKRLLSAVLLVASVAQAHLQIDTSYQLSDGARRSAKLFLVDKDLNGEGWITLPQAKGRYRVKVKAKQVDDLRVLLNFAVTEKVGKEEKVVARPSVTTLLGEPASVEQRKKDGSLLFRVQVTPSDLDG